MCGFRHRGRMSVLRGRVRRVAKKLEPLYLIEGKEAFLRNQALADLRALAAGPTGAPAETRFEGAKATLAAVLDELRTLPFFAASRLVHVSDADEFIAACTRDGPEDLERALDEIKTFTRSS